MPQCSRSLSGFIVLLTKVLTCTRVSHASGVTVISRGALLVPGHSLVPGTSSVFEYETIFRGASAFEAGLRAHFVNALTTNAFVASSSSRFVLREQTRKVDVRSPWTGRRLSLLP